MLGAAFRPTGLGERIFKERYARSPEETWEEACERLALTMAAAEENGSVERFQTRFQHELQDGYFMPGGRIWFGAGRSNQQMLNCFVVPTEDSKEGWFKSLYDMGVISATGGGVGLNISPVRGRGYPIKGNGGVSTGAVSLMQMFDRVGDVLISGGGRRLALMLDLNIDHPDIEEFLNVKLDLGELNNANISVVLPEHISTEEFQRLVAENAEIELTFNGLPDKLGRTIKAGDFWNRLVQNAWNSGEPGVLNSYLANKMNTMYYKWPLISTNPCVTGDTVIATVDGPQTFKALAESGKNVMVYAWHPQTKKPVVRWMRNPRCTRENVELLEVEFDSGLKVRCTPDHNFYSFRGKKVQAQDLHVGSSVRAWSMSEHRDGHLRVHGWDAEANRAAHQWVGRMVYECCYGEVPAGHVVHHNDGDQKNNDPRNLQPITAIQHNQIHYPDRFENGFDGKASNHKVVGVRRLELREDVYNGTVDDAHTYIILDPDPIAGIQSGIVSANCGEIWLPAYGCCCLGALVLPNFVEDGELNWEKLDESIRLGTRFLDNVLSVNDYPLPEIKKVCQEERRIGLGVMGLHSMLLDLGLRYSSAESFSFVDKLFGFIKNTAYDASVTLAAEKGPFPAYSPQYLGSGFAKTLKRGIRSKIREYGIRNCALLTIAPTGTTSMVHGVTGGLEPLFSPLYIRRRKMIDDMAKEYRIETLVVSKEYLDHPDLVEGAYDISPGDHILMQVTVQRHIDNAVSKTINLAEDYPVEDLSRLWLENLTHMKGSTFYRQGSRGLEPMTHVPVADMDSLLASWDGEIEYEDPTSLECPNGSCEIQLIAGD